MLIAKREDGTREGGGLWNKGPRRWRGRGQGREEFGEVLARNRRGIGYAQVEREAMGHGPLAREIAQR